MNWKPCVVLLANLIAALPLLANAQDPRIVQRQAAGAKEPRIEIVRASSERTQRLRSFSFD